MTSKFSIYFYFMKEHILYNSEMIKKQYNWEIEEEKLLNIYRQLIQ